MSGAVLILRPEPGASVTADRARTLGLVPFVFPLFVITPLEWQAPDPQPFEAVLLTSANAARHAGDKLRTFTHLPCYAVGESTAKAAADAGFADVRTGLSDVEAVNAMMIEDRVRLVFHPCGRDHRELPRPGPTIVQVVVYAADAIDELPAAADAAMAAGAVVLVHSPRAASLLAGLARDRGNVAVVAISAAAAEAAGAGWRSVSVAEAPRDEALLELAAKLCQTDLYGPRP